ncbi:endothelial cell-selective adhesion molecule [Oryzias latipes]|uniref:endothelial cell-selective adhesion molecule n=1 Tax=Oryzias latipes TaxID=8090 RepID=UPI000CE27834|nr:endothelial cell-selective adhesion molecule [Oryzias latipes]
MEQELERLRAERTLRCSHCCVFGSSQKVGSCCKSPCLVTEQKHVAFVLAGVSQETGACSGLKALTSIDVVRGAQVELKASSNSNIEQSGSTVIWNFISDSIVLVISYNKGSTVYGSQFKGRVGFVNQMPSQDVSLMINKTLESDSGRYACQVITSGTVPFVTEFSLNVKVPPSPPNCSVIGTPTLRGNVTLSCMSSEGKPAPLYHWKKTKPKTEIFFPPMQNSEAGTLKLTNLSSNMTGLYVCTANNTVGSANCSINLEIISTNKVGMIVGATVGSVLGFIFLIFILIGFLVVFKKRSYVEDDMANEIKEDAQAPKRVSWAKSGMGSDVISKNGTLSSIASSPHHRGYSRHHDSHHQQPRHPASDTASIITATGSTGGYRPPRHQGASTPTHYNYNNSSTLQRGPPTSTEPVTNGSSVPVQERYSQLPQAQMLQQTYGHPQTQAVPSPPPLPTSTITASHISRMGGVPIMVPAQNQAGSLV